MNTDDGTPEEKTADSLTALWTAMKDREFSDAVCVEIINSATPVVINHYLKGQ